MGKIGLGDSAFLRSIDNLKEARELFAVREQQYDRKVNAANQQNQQAALAANQQAAQLKMQGTIEEQNNQGKVDAELTKLEYQLKERLAQIENGITAQSKQFGDQIKVMVKKQEGTDRMITQALKNRAEIYKADKQAETASKKQAVS